MRICIVKATNQIIEMQSSAVVGTLTRNATIQGYNTDDIEEREVTPEEYKAALNLDPITIAMREAETAARELKQTKLTSIQDNLPSWNVVSNAVDNITNLAEAKTYLKKLSRVVYWLAKNSET
jgi:hypothetical protein